MILGLIRWLGNILGSGAKPLPAKCRKINDEATQVLQPAYTVRLRPPSDEQDQDKAAGGAGQQDARLLMTWHGLTDVGAVRNHNEDTFSCVELEGNKLFIVADGMGGHDAGEVASELAVQTAVREFSENARHSDDPRKLLENTVHRVNKAVKAEGESRDSNMGTTLSAVFVANCIAYIASVGDSRVYWIENGTITQITEDHSLVAKLVRTGKLTRTEARNHPRANLLYRTVGNDESITVDTFQVKLKRKGCLLLCTDGLWGEVSDKEIREIVNGERDAASVCARLVRRANENGGKDNITAVVVKLS